MPPEAQQIVIQREAPAEDPKHIEAMVAKVEGQEAPSQTPAPEGEAPATDRPQWLPEKFKSAEDMAKAYAELEAKQAGKTPEGDPPKDPEVATESDASKALADKGLAFEEFSKEFGESGALSQESYDKLSKAGIDKGIVDQYIAGQQALAAQYESEVKAVAGGAESFDEVVAWAAENMSREEKVAYNKAIDSGDLDQAKLAVAGITQKFQAVRPSEGKRIQGGSGTSTGDSYASLAQMTADMSNPLYKNDPAFRKSVENKIRNSKIL